MNSKSQHKIILLFSFYIFIIPQSQGCFNEQDSIRFHDWMTLGDSLLYETNSNEATLALDSAIYLAKEKNCVLFEIKAITLRGARGIMMNEIDLVEQTLEVVPLMLRQNEKELYSEMVSLQNDIEEVRLFLYISFLGDYSQAINVGKKIYENAQYEQDEEKRKSLEYRTLNTIATAYVRKGQYQLAKDYYEEADQKLIEDFSLLTVGNYLLKLKDFKEAEKYFLQYLEKLESNNIDFFDDMYQYSYHGLIDTYISMDSLALAEKYLYTFKRNHQKGNNLAAYTNKISGRLLLAKRQPHLALKEFEVGILNLERENNQKDHNAQFFDFYIGKSRAYTQQQNFQLALKESQRTFSLLLSDFKNQSVDVNPPPSEVERPLQILEAFIQKLQVLQSQFESSKSQENLRLGMLTSEVAINWITATLPHIGSNSDRQILIDHSYSIFESAIYFARAANQPRLAFKYSEESRGIVLSQALKRKKDDILGKKYPDLVYQIKRLNVKILGYELKSKFVKTDANSISEERLIQDSLFIFKKNLRLLEDNLEQKFAKTGNPWDNKMNPDWEKYKSQLDDDQVLLEFFVGEKMIYPFLLDKKNGVQSPPPISFDKELKNAIATINDDIYYGKKAGRKAAYFSKASLIFQKLFKPLFFDELPSRLVIVPDGDLGYVPFSILFTEPKDTNRGYKNLPYFFKETSISLAFSAAMLFREKSNTEKLKYQKMLAYAPAFKDIPNVDNSDFRKNQGLLDTLTQTYKEVKFLDENFNVDVLLQNQATKAHFLEHCVFYDFLHLATHAKVDKLEPDYSYVAFSNVPQNNIDKSEDEYILTLAEIYGLNLSTKMLVLSACETGIGRSLKGEGIISIARGFASTGVQSIVTSLWSVPDNQTAQIMELFYENLKIGLEKDVALQKAMKQYIEDDALEDFNQHPQLWAAFTVIGDTTAVDIPERSSKMLYIIFGGIVLLVFLILLRKVKIRL